MLRDIHPSYVSLKGGGGKLLPNFPLRTHMLIINVFSDLALFMGQDHETKATVLLFPLCLITLFKVPSIPLFQGQVLFHSSCLKPSNWAAHV